MEDSSEPNLLLVVPSSVDDSEPSAFQSAADNPLGLPANLVHPRTTCATDGVDSPSFSCFELSGKVTESNSESSASTVFRIYENDSDLIPPSPPEVLHIDLSATPSVRRQVSSSAGTSLEESLEQGMDSGRESPELISSATPSPSQEGGKSSTDFQSAEAGDCSAITPSAEVPDSAADVINASVSPKPGSHTPVAEDAVLKEKPEIMTKEPQSSQPMTSSSSPAHLESKDDITQLSSKSHSEPVVLSWGGRDDFDGDTESYSQTKDDSAAFLKKYAVGDNPTPVILTESTQAESERNKMDSSSLGFKAPMGCTSDVVTTEKVADVKKDATMQEEEQKEEEFAKDGAVEEDQNDQSQLLLPGADSQDFTQEEDIHLHLTFSQSQSQFDVPCAEEGLKIGEESRQQQREPERIVPGEKRTEMDQNLSQSAKISDTGSDSANPDDEGITVNSDSQEAENAERSGSLVKPDDIETSQAAKRRDDSTPPSCLSFAASSSSNSGAPIQNSPNNANTPTSPQRSSMTSDQKSSDTSSSGAATRDSAAEPHEVELETNPGESRNANNQDFQKVSPKSIESEPVTSSDTSGHFHIYTPDTSTPNAPGVQAKPHHVHIRKEPIGSSLESSVSVSTVNPSLESSSSLSTVFPKDTESEAMESGVETDSMTSTCLDDDKKQEGNAEVVPGPSIEDMETQPFCYLDSQSQELMIVSDEEEEERESQPSLRDPTDTTSLDEEAVTKSKPSDSQKVIQGLLSDILTNVESNIFENVVNAGVEADVTASATPNAPRDNDASKSSTTATETVTKKNAKPNGDALDGRSRSSTLNGNRPKTSEGPQINSPFRSPTDPPRTARRASGGKKKSPGQGRIAMETDGNNNVVESALRAVADEHDKSSDTLPVDDNSERSTDLEASSPRAGLVYRVTKCVVKETLRDGKVVDTKVIIEGKPRLYSSDPSISSHSSNGSGYLGDISSFSRTSSDTSTQTRMSQLQTLNEPPLRRDLSGSSSNSGSSLGIPPPGAAMQPSTRTTKQRHASHSSLQSSEKAASPGVSPIPSPATTTGELASTSGLSGHDMMHATPTVKESRVVLTPLRWDNLSMEPVASEAGTMGDATSGAIATPPTVPNINPPPLSVSTPMCPSQDSSEISSSNSPEIPFPDSVPESQNASFSFEPSLSMRESPTSPPPLAISEGIKVMAKAGRENYYYPGVIRKQDPSSGKFTVLFEDDGRERQVRESDILLIEMLPVGQEVYARSDSEDPSDYYSSGKILSYWRDPDKNIQGYVIEKVEGDSQSTYTRRYSRRQVIVKQESLKSELKILKVQPVASPTTADVSLDNVLDGKRRSRRSLAVLSVTHASPSPRNARTPRSTRKRQVHDSESSGSSSCVPFPSTKKSKRAKLSFVNPGSPAPPKVPTKKGRGKAASETYVQSEIFKNCGFLTTSTTGKDQPSSEFDSPPCAVGRLGYDRQDIQKKILAGGGVVAKNFTQLMTCDRGQLYVVSDNFCRTMNYFNALAAGISCLSYLWVEESSRARKLQSTRAYLLQAGYSIEQQRVVERLSIPIQPLSGMRVSLQVKEPTTWNTLLSIAGCDSVTTSRQQAKKAEYSLSCDVVVADTSCCRDLLKTAKSLAIPVVTVEWIIQCLINGERLPFDGLPQYRLIAEVQ